MNRNSKAILAIAIMLTALGLVSCHKTETQPQGGLELTSRFIPQSGTKLQSIAEVPDVSWYFETIRGVCEPDSMVLWLSYDGVDYMTNVMGAEAGFKLLEKTGMKKIKEDRPDFKKADFSPNAVIVSNGLDLTHDEFMQIEDSLFRQKIQAVEDTITAFFVSGGDTRYMAEPMATNWRLIKSQTENGETEPANPFNGGPVSEFREGSVRVVVTDPSKGVAEVAAYCLDPYTTGVPGWAYWTVIFCQKKGAYLIKETPIQHNPFVVG